MPADLSGRTPATASSSPSFFGRPIFYGWIVVAGCFCMSIVSGAFVYARGVFLPEMADDFGGSRLNITLAFSLAQAVGAFSSPFIGMALDRWHPRVVLLTGAVMVTMAYFLTALATSYLALYAVFGLLFGAGWRGISSFSTSRVLVRWFNRRRGLALSIDVAGASVAGIFVPLIAVWMMQAFGWRPGFAVFGIFTLTIVIPLVLFVIKASPQDIGQHPDGIPPESVETSESAASDTPPDEASDKSSAASDAPDGLMAYSQAWSKPVGMQPTHSCGSPPETISVD